MMKCINCDNALIARHRTVYPSNDYKMVTDWVIDKIRCDCKMSQVNEYHEVNCPKFKQKEEW